MICREKGYEAVLQEKLRKPPVSHPYERRGAEENSSPLWSSLSSFGPVQVRKNGTKPSVARPAGNWNPNGRHQPCLRVTVPEFLQGSEKGFASLPAFARAWFFLWVPQSSAPVAGGEGAGQGGSFPSLVSERGSPKASPRPSACEGPDQELRSAYVVALRRCALPPESWCGRPPHHTGTHPQQNTL